MFDNNTYHQIQSDISSALGVYSGGIIPIKTTRSLAGELQNKYGDQFHDSIHGMIVDELRVLGYDIRGADWIKVQ